MGRIKIKKILLVDDDLDDQAIFKLALEDVRPDCRVATASDGVEAYQELLHTPEATIYDIIFLDINMPRMNGKELLPKIKAMERHRHVPIIVYSTSYAIEEIKYMLAAGAHTYIRKAHSYKQLCMDISTILNEVESAS